MPRHNKALITVLIVFGVGGACIATIYLSVYIANRQSHVASSADQACKPGHHSTHQVVIKNNKATPSNTVAPLCDTLTITNLDDTERLTAFGVHVRHVPYDGITEKILTQRQSLTVTLVQAGNFRFHDHWHDEVQGAFTVTKAK